MKWIELKQVDGGGCIFLFGCHPTQSAYKVKLWLKEQKPHVVILFADQHRRIREYQAAHWVRKYDDHVYHNYLTTGHRKSPVNTAIKSLESALQHFANQHKFTPSEIVLVRAKKFVNT